MALKQRFAQIAAAKEKLTLADRALRMKQVEKDIQRENKWFKIAHILIGVVIGIGLTTFYFSVPNTPKNLAPVVQNDK